MNVYWANDGDGTLMKVPKDGGSPTTLISGQTVPLCVAVDEKYLYWTNYPAAGTVMALPLAGGAPIELACGQGSPSGIAVDATSVYWAAQGDNAVRKTVKPN